MANSCYGSGTVYESARHSRRNGKLVEQPLKTGFRRASAQLAKAASNKLYSWLQLAKAGSKQASFLLDRDAPCGRIICLSIEVFAIRDLGFCLKLNHHMSHFVNRIVLLTCGSELEHWHSYHSCPFWYMTVSLTFYIWLSANDFQSSLIIVRTEKL